MTSVLLATLASLGWAPSVPSESRSRHVGEIADAVQRQGGCIVVVTYPTGGLASALFFASVIMGRLKARGCRLPFPTSLAVLPGTAIEWGAIWEVARTAGIVIPMVVSAGTEIPSYALTVVCVEEDLRVTKKP